MTPIEWGLASPLQLPFTVPYSAWRVWGVRLDAVLARSLDVYGIDGGLVGLTYGDFAGVQAAAFNWVGDSAYGLQLGVIGNVAKGPAGGLQLAGFANYIPEALAGIQAAGLVNVNGGFYGLQVAPANVTTGVGVGLQLGVWNRTDNEFTGGSVGLVNYAENMTGMQLGFNKEGFEQTLLGVFNAAGQFEGLQIGFLNLINDGKAPYVLPFANARF